MVVLKSEDHQIEHIIWETMNVCTKACAKPLSICWHISLHKWKIWPAGGARGNVRGRFQWLRRYSNNCEWISAVKFTVIYQIAGKTFLSESQMSICWRHYRKNPLGTVNVCTEFHGNPSNRCWVISVCGGPMDRWTNRKVTPCVTVSSDNIYSA